jgi:hypothetical protein
MHGRRILALAVSALLVGVGPAAAGGGSVRHEGSCSGPGDWHLRVSRETATTLKVRFDIEHVDPGDSWQLFLSDNGHRIYSATKVAGADGEVHAKKITSDRAGTDRVKASGVDVTSGGSCDAALTY